MKEKDKLSKTKGKKREKMITLRNERGQSPFDLGREVATVPKKEYLEMAAKGFLVG